jgi:hypothetical protein
VAAETFFRVLLKLAAAQIRREEGTRKTGVVVRVMPLSFASGRAILALSKNALAIVKRRSREE